MVSKAQKKRANIPDFHQAALLVGFICWSVPVLAESIDISKVLDGLKNNPLVEAKHALIQSAQADLGVLESMDSPKVTADAMSPLAGGHNSDQPDYTMRVETSLYDWGANRNLIASGTAYLEARGMERDQAVLDLAVGTSDMFHQLASSFLQLGVFVNARKSLQDLVQMMGRRVEQKVSPQVDLDIVESRAALIDVRIEQLHREVRRHQLSILRDTEIMVEDPDLSSCALDVEPLDRALVVRALDTSPGLKMYDASIAALASEAEALRSELYPQIVGGYQVDTELNGNNFDQQGYLALRFEFQTGGNFDSRVAASRARLLEKRALRNEKAEAISQQVSDLISAYLTSRRLVGIQKSLADARASQKESYLRRFVAGRASWADVLSADQELVEARVAQISARVSACGALSAMAILVKADHPYRISESGSPPTWSR